MAEINIRFRLNINDFFEFNNIFYKKRSRVLIFAEIAIFGFILIQNILAEEKSYLMIAVSVIAILAILITVISKRYITKASIEKAYKEHFLLKTDIMMEFYNDHIVEKNDGGQTNIKFEEHFPFEAIKSVIETNNGYLFFISPCETLIVPKRALDEENTVKMNNLIQNVFYSRYEKQI